jgi:hypothetical protein
MKISKTLPGLLTVAILALATMPAQAIPVYWNLSGTTFGDGGTASGSFFYDASTNGYSAIDIITTAGSALSGESYNAAAYGWNSGLVLQSSAARWLTLAFSSQLTNAGTPVSVVLAGEYDFAQHGWRNSTSGSLVDPPGPTVVAEPATFALLGLGLAGIGLARRRFAR